MVDRDIDILVVGGGLTGAALMLALADAGFSTLLVEAKPVSEHANAHFDARSLALSPASMRILQMLGVWPLLQDSVAAIDTIHVSEQYHFGSARLHGEEKNPLGHVVEMHHIDRALCQLLDQKRILAPAWVTAINSTAGTATITGPTGDTTVQARLIVAADGTHSSIRALCGLKTQIKDYAQHAIVANIGLARPHQQCAYERFTSTGPLAMLPLTGQRSSLVWAMPPNDAARLMDMPDSGFLNHLQRAFGYRLGRFTRAGQRMVYPLQQVLMPEQVCDKVVFVGNAAHTLHPVAGQGFNLGLRDIAMLAQCLVREGLGPEMLQTYQQSRRYDQTAITRFTNGLVELFTSQLPGMGLIRSAGMIAVDNSPVLKKLLARYARGYAGVIPDLVCGIQLANTLPFTGKDLK